MIAPELDVIIVGAGLSGLAAARSLRRSNVSAIVLEARDRVGGRIHTQKVPGGHVDLGARWIGSGQDRMARLVRRLTFEKYPTFSRGEKLLSLAGALRPYRRSTPPLSALALVQFGLTLTKLDRMRRKVDPEEPWAAKQAQRWDSLTLGDWLERNVSHLEVRAVLSSACSTIFGCDPSEVSFLYFLLFLNASGGLRALLDVQDGAQQDCIVGGMQQLPEKLAEMIAGTVVLGAPVTRIQQDADGVTVVAQGQEYRGRFVIVTVPPPFVLEMSFSPALPPERDRLLRGMPSGSMVKVIATYDTPFWRSAGYSGEAVSDTGPFRVVFDDSEHDCRPAALVGFVVGEPARRWAERPEERRRAIALEEFARLFGHEAREPSGYIEADWTRGPWTRGGPNSFMVPGALTQYGHALRAPFRRVHWAGAETALAWVGHMEGAVEAGERAALEVLSRLSRQQGDSERSDPEAVG